MKVGLGSDVAGGVSPSMLVHMRAAVVASRAVQHVASRRWSALGRENVLADEENLPAVKAAVAATLSAEATTGALAQNPDSEEAVRTRVLAMVAGQNATECAAAAAASSAAAAAAHAIGQGLPDHACHVSIHISEPYFLNESAYDDVTW